MQAWEQVWEQGGQSEPQKLGLRLELELESPAAFRSHSHHLRVPYAYECDGVSSCLARQLRVHRQLIYASPPPPQVLVVLIRQQQAWRKTSDGVQEKGQKQEQEQQAFLEGHRELVQ